MKAHPVFPVVAAAAWLWLAAAFPAAARNGVPEITVEVAIHIGIDPATGNLPLNQTQAAIIAQFDAAIADANRIYQRHWRGYRLHRKSVDLIGGLGVYTGPGQWMALRPTQTKLDPTTPDPNDVCQILPRNNTRKEIDTNPTAYKFDSTALNFYVYNPMPHMAGYTVRPGIDDPTWAFIFAGFYCEPPDPPPPSWEDAKSILIFHSTGWSEGWFIAHEAGHWFGLIHSFAEGNPGDYVDDTYGGEYKDGRDGLAARNYNGRLYQDLSIQEKIDINLEVDAAVETGWRDGLARFNTGKALSALTADELTHVNNAYNNLLSYFPSRGEWNAVTQLPNGIVLTEGQLDRWADCVTSFHSWIVDGNTWFFGGSGGGASGGKSTTPYYGPFTAAASATVLAGDTLVGRQGTYSGSTGTLNKPMTLRATHNGPVSLGGSLHPAFAIPVK